MAFMVTEFDVALLPLNPLEFCACTRQVYVDPDTGDADVMAIGDVELVPVNVVAPDVQEAR